MNGHVSNEVGLDLLDIPLSVASDRNIELVHHPEPFLRIVHHREGSGSPLVPSLTGACAGFEGGRWRYRQLAGHLIQWLPEFALSPSEYGSIRGRNCVAQLQRAAELVYQSRHFRRRGEFGELLLHVLIRQVCNTQLAISKIFFKDSSNDTVKGFDAVHVVATPQGLELWLGEAKLYSRAGDAIREAASSIRDHATANFLRREFVVITNKIDPAWQHAEKLRRLIHRDTSLDEVFDRLCIPVLLTYDSRALSQFTSFCSDYLTAIRSELNSHFERFCTRQLPSNVRIHVFFVPMNTKEKLTSELDRKLRACQNIL